MSLPHQTSGDEDESHCGTIRFDIGRVLSATSRYEVVDDRQRNVFDQQGHGQLGVERHQRVAVFAVHTRHAFRDTHTFLNSECQELQDI